MTESEKNAKNEKKLAQKAVIMKWGKLPRPSMLAVGELIFEYRFSALLGDLAYIDAKWYVTHSGLLRLAERRHCAGIHVRPVLKSCDPASSRWVFRAVVFKSR